MGRIIINNRSDASDYDAVSMVLRVIEKGRISNNGKQYCYLSSIGEGKTQIDIATDLRERSDSFTLYNSPYRKKKITMSIQIQFIDNPEDDFNLPTDDDFEDEYNEDDYEPDCFYCNATGEGYTPDTRCAYCFGRGTIKKRKY